MAKITLEEQPEFATFPTDSILELKVEEVTVRTVNGRNGDWQKVELKFKILGIQAIGDGSPVANYEGEITRNIFGSVPFRLTDNPENKLRIWAEAIFGQELGLGFELDTDMFLNRKVKGLTSQYNKKAINPATGQPFVAHQIETLLPMSGGFAPAASAAPVAAAAAAPAGDPWGAPAAAAGDPWGSSSTAFNDEPPF